MGPLSWCMLERGMGILKAQCKSELFSRLPFIISRIKRWTDPQPHHIPGQLGSTSSPVAIIYPEAREPAPAQACIYTHIYQEGQGTPPLWNHSCNLSTCATILPHPLSTVDIRNNFLIIVVVAVPCTNTQPVTQDESFYLFSFLQYSLFPTHNKHAHEIYLMNEKQISLNSLPCLLETSKCYVSPSVH